MNRYKPIIFSAIFFLIAFIPCQLLAASITQTKAEIGEDCTASGRHSTAMGYATTASGPASTAMGVNTTASGYNSTAMGDWTTASGDYSTSMGDSTTASGPASTAMGQLNSAGGMNSFAGGSNMRLASSASNTFVWGSSPSQQPNDIPTAYAFLIFPVGTPGNVGIGTSDPERILHIVGANPRILLEASSLNAEVNFMNSGDPDNIRWSLYKDSNSDDLRFYQGGNKMTIQNATGNVGIGATTPWYKLEVAGDAAKSSGGTTWINSSDERLKDITDQYDRGLDAIVSLRPVTFFYKTGNPRGLPSDEENIGFIAQEVQEVFPEAVSEGSDGYLDFNMHPVNVAVVNAIKELNAENEALKAENETLRQRIEKIEELLGI